MVYNGEAQRRVLQGPDKKNPPVIYVSGEAKVCGTNIWPWGCILHYGKYKGRRGISGHGPETCAARVNHRGVEAGSTIGQGDDRPT